jgi:chemotaxis protein MotB
VAGHTDNTPIKTPQFPSNWELSTARAVNVAKYLIASGVTPERVSVQGYASYRPLRANTSSQNRQANRRVEITLSKDHEPESAPPPH